METKQGKRLTKMKGMLRAASCFTGPVTLAPELESLVTHSNFDEMSKRGFKPRELKDDIWSKSEIQMLKDAIADISNGKAKPETSDFMYWISIRIFHGVKTPLQIEWKVIKIIISIY